MSTSSLNHSTNVLSAKHRLLQFHAIPRACKVHLLSVSSGGRWVMVSLTGPDGNLVVVMDANNMSVFRLHDIGSTCVTCVVWLSDEQFFAGLDDGAACIGIITHSGGLEMLRIRIAPFRNEGAVTAIANRYEGGYLALSNAQEVIMSRGDPTSEHLANAQLARVEPFSDNPRSTITNMFFSAHGNSGLNLIISGTGGLAIYSIQAAFMANIFKHVGYQVGYSSISHDDRYLALSTLNHELVYVRLDSNGPVPGTFNLIRLPNHAGSALPIAFTPAGCVVSGSSTGEVRFIETGEGRCRCMRCNRFHLIKVVAAFGDRVYTVAEKREDPGVLAVVCHERTSV